MAVLHHHIEQFLEQLYHALFELQVIFDFKQVLNDFHDWIEKNIFFYFGLGPKVVSVDFVVVVEANWVDEHAARTDDEFSRLLADLLLPFSMFLVS
eukprot:CAMPEP_0116925404 /NCGR_PEP_ID=MMETSP0467-20121206/24100_1 /TAXON_ID=283647 /ORGANISM="Mesodinium pulex, Strain SPMC105" /LENGTH=95 /DNA_ID=CAMNT_0004604445 /DNA_START=1911 /DNA_END=2198 /DNA_ORIENTATION=+